MERLISPEGLIKLLQDGIDKGWWTLEDLDHPSEMFLENLMASNHPKSLCKDKFPQYTNPLRDSSQKEPSPDPAPDTGTDDARGEPPLPIQRHLPGRQRVGSGESNDQGGQGLDIPKIPRSSTTGDGHSRLHGAVPENRPTDPDWIPW